MAADSILELLNGNGPELLILLSVMILGYVVFQLAKDLVSDWFKL